LPHNEPPDLNLGNKGVGIQICHHGDVIVCTTEKKKQKKKNQKIASRFGVLPQEYGGERVGNAR